MLQVQPSAKVLEHMVWLQLHLDNCSEENGATGSHLHGPDPMQGPMMRAIPVMCPVGVSGALLMRPFLLSDLVALASAGISPGDASGGPLTCSCPGMRVLSGAVAEV